jgi:4-hydroxy-tetrahydrodipicolinate synthase
MTHPHAALRGSYTALISPFSPEGALDIAAFEALVEWQVNEGIHGLVPCGTTGESPTLSHEEHKLLIERTVNVANGRVPVMAGAGSNSTAEAIDFVSHAEKAGASSALIVAPYYNKPTQEGLFAHYRAIADSTALPIIVYNIPGRSVINISDATLARLAEACPNIAGVKDATGDLARVSTLRALVGNRLALFSGEDMTAVGFNAMGGQGVISVTSNIVPKRVAEIQTLTLNGQFSEALALHETLVNLHHSMFLETNPVPVKYAASLLGKCRPNVRLPLVACSDATQQAVHTAMQHAGLV